MSSKQARVVVAFGVVLLLVVLATILLHKKPAPVSPLEGEPTSNPIDDTFWEHLDRRNYQNYRGQLKTAPSLLVVRLSHFKISPQNNIGMQWGWIDGKMANLAVSFSTLVSYGYSEHAVWDEHLMTRTEFPSYLGQLTNTYDVIDTLPDHPKEKLQAEIKKQLRQQFGLAWHHEIRKTEALAIEVKDLKVLNSRINREFSKSKSIPELTEELENYFGKPVLDETGQTNRYDKDLELVPARWINGRATDLDSNNEFLAQYGLQLVVTNQPMEWLALDTSFRERLSRWFRLNLGRLFR